MWAERVYRRYTREDALVQTNGFFSLNLRASAVKSIIGLLDLTCDSVVAWVGCGDGREVLSIAKEFPSVQFHAFEINADALRVARRVAASEGVSNVAFHHKSFVDAPRGASFTHVYSTALAGQALYARLAEACTEKLCVLSEMRPCGSPPIAATTVRLMGSGEQRQLVCVSPSVDDGGRGAVP